MYIFLSPNMSLVVLALDFIQAIIIFGLSTAYVIEKSRREAAEAKLAEVDAQIDHALAVVHELKQERYAVQTALGNLPQPDLTYPAVAALDVETTGT